MEIHSLLADLQRQFPGQVLGFHDQFREDSVEVVSGAGWGARVPWRPAPCVAGAFAERAE